MGHRLRGKTAIVTGSSRGIGLAIASAFAEQGASVVTNSRQYERAKSTAEDIKASGGQAVPAEADVSDSDAMTAIVETAVEEFGSLDVMVNNAATTVIGPAEEISAGQWRHVVETNLTGVFFGSQAAARHLIPADHGGQIINLSSIFGEGGAPNRSPYAATKGGINNLTRCLAYEWAPHDISVNTIAPGYIWTEGAKDGIAASAHTADDIREKSPMGRLGTPE